MRCSILLIAIFGLPSSLLLSRAVAQDAPPQGTEALKASGTIEEMTSEQELRLKVSDSEIWLVEIKPETKVEVTGTAESAFLRPGLHVRFDGEIDKKGNLQADIGELEIFTPQGKNGLGLFADNSPTAKPIAKAAPGKYQIRAKVVSLKDHDITLAAGSKKLFGKVAEELTVKVASEDFTYVRDGDTVTIDGWYLPPNKAAAGKPGQSVAEGLTITLAKPLVATKKPARAVAKSAKARRAAREPKEGDEEGPPTVQDPFGVDGKKPAQ
ncbi:MAG TPA: hypothetical protein VHY91_18960 [Pirellulales bacterium]|jgi:hypothetical protein|nr:hypothetical protein [Pirellulales bacterium]